MSDDIVKRLKTQADQVAKWPATAMIEAAARIETMTAERDRLRALLAEADRRIAWESLGFGNDFADRVEAALKGETEPNEYERNLAQMKEDFPNGV